MIWYTEEIDCGVAYRYTYVKKENDCWLIYNSKEELIVNNGSPWDVLSYITKSLSLPHPLLSNESK